MVPWSRSGQTLALLGSRAIATSGTASHGLLWAAQGLSIASAAASATSSLSGGAGQQVLGAQAEAASGSSSAATPCLAAAAALATVVAAGAAVTFTRGTQQEGQQQQQAASGASVLQAVQGLVLGRWRAAARAPPPSIPGSPNTGTSSKSTAASSQTKNPQLVALLAQDPGAAVACALTAPLAVLLQESVPMGPDACAALAHAARSLLERQQQQASGGSAGQAGPLAAWERNALMRGLALLLGPELRTLSPKVARLMEAELAATCSRRGAGIRDLASQAWSVAVVCGGLSQELLSGLQRALSGLSITELAEEGSLLLLLDALMLTAAHTGGPSASGTGASAGPRASRAAVAALAAPAGSRAAAALLDTYDDTVPFDGGVGSAMFVVIHALMGVPHLVDVATGGNSSGGGGSSWWGGMLGGSGGSTAGAAAAAAATREVAAAVPPGFGPEAHAVLGGAKQGSTVRGPAHVSRIHKELARVRRDVVFHWRQDELVDARQQAANEAAFLLARAAGGQQYVQRPADADVVLWPQRLALIIEDSGAGPQPQPSATSSGAGSSSSQSHALRPFSPGVGAACMQRLALDHGAPAARYARNACPGLQAAHNAAVGALGWRLERLGVEQWRAVSGAELLAGRPQSSIKPGEAAALEAQRVELLKAWLRGSPGVAAA